MFAVLVEKGFREVVLFDVPLHFNEGQLLERCGHLDDAFKLGDVGGVDLRGEDLNCVSDVVADSLVLHCVVVAESKITYVTEQSLVDLSRMNSSLHCLLLMILSSKLYSAWYSFPLFSPSKWLSLIMFIYYIGFK